ncbi:expressed unknown protein [Seminavis robusta]|uniref:BZIP domain-containing protein n=1 Tax=Seminavis robusta TaxID=568900 RepID=A0A9N8DUM8_9STRA|nr:expressed unknown protein [Seminavis robusta]|eukprot:Sro384_g131510.1 n/a (430) ;mRNA; f:46605-47894
MNSTPSEADNNEDASTEEAPRRVSDGSSGNSESGFSKPSFSFESDEFKATIELIHPELKEDLLHALATVPELVATESPLDRYVAASRVGHNTNMLNACQRLAGYWQMRRRVFAAHAYKPLTMLPGGALCGEQNLEMIQTGAFVLLPKDQSGRSVVSGNTSKMAPQHSFPHYRFAKARMMFYLLHLAALNPVSQSSGAVWISVINQSPTMEAFLFTKRVARAMPVRRWFTRIVFPPRRFGALEASLPTFFLQGLGIGTLVPRNAVDIEFFGGSSNEEILQKLQAAGFTRRRLPVSIGGDWDAHDAWIKRQMKEDEGIFLTHEEKEERKKKAMAEQSRNKRKRRKEWEDELQQKHQQLQKDNTALQEENERLEAMLAHAQEEVAFVTTMDQLTTTMDDDDDELPIPLTDDEFYSPDQVRFEEDVLDRLLQA